MTLIDSMGPIKDAIRGRPLITLHRNLFLLTPSLPCGDTQYHIKSIFKPSKSKGEFFSQNSL